MTDDFEFTRQSEGYEPRFDIDWIIGERGERLVQHLIEAHERGSVYVEVKTDEVAVYTGNVYIETECLGRDGWQPSGIATTKAEVWAHVVGALVFFLPVSVIREMVAGKRGREQSCDRGDHPTRGRVFTIAEFAALANRRQRDVA